MKVISGNQINITHAMFVVNILYSLYFKKSVNIIKLRQLIYKYIINCNHAPHAVVIKHNLIIICIFFFFTRFCSNQRSRAEKNSTLKTHLRRFSTW